jgi:hypothetical protein
MGTDSAFRYASRQMTDTDTKSVVAERRAIRPLRWIGRFLKRHVLIVVGVIVVGGGGCGYYYWIQMLPASQVEVQVAQRKPNPCTDVYAPLFVALLNRSPRTVIHVSYRLIAQHPGQGTNLVEGDEIRQLTDIAKPHRGFGYCQKVPLLTERFVSWQSLDWTAEIVSVSFE